MSVRTLTKEQQNMISNALQSLQNPELGQLIQEIIEAVNAGGGDLSRSIPIDFHLNSIVGPAGITDAGWTGMASDSIYFMPPALLAGEAHVKYKFDAGLDIVWNGAQELLCRLKLVYADKNWSELGTVYVDLPNFRISTTESILSVSVEIPSTVFPANAVNWYGDLEVRAQGGDSGNCTFDQRYSNGNLERIYTPAP